MIDEELHYEIKRLIIERLNLEDVTPEDVDTDAPLFGEGLGLDSIDALEAELGLKRKWGVVLPKGDKEAFRVLTSVRTIADYLRKNGVK